MPQAEPARVEEEEEEEHTEQQQHPQQQQQKGDSQPSVEQEPVLVATPPRADSSAAAADAGSEPCSGSKVQAASSAFDFFARVRRPVLHSELLAELERGLASEWSGLSDEARRPYQEFEATDRRRFQAEEFMATQLPRCSPKAK